MNFSKILNQILLTSCSVWLLSGCNNGSQASSNAIEQQQSQQKSTTALESPTLSGNNPTTKLSQTATISDLFDIPQKYKPNRQLVRPDMETSLNIRLAFYRYAPVVTLYIAKDETKSGDVSEVTPNVPITCKLDNNKDEESTFSSAGIIKHNPYGSLKQTITIDPISNKTTTSRPADILEIDTDALANTPYKNCHFALNSINGRINVYINEDDDNFITFYAELYRYVVPHNDYAVGKNTLLNPQDTSTFYQIQSYWRGVVPPMQLVFPAGLPVFSEDDNINPLALHQSEIYMGASTNQEFYNWGFVNTYLREDIKRMLWIYPYPSIDYNL